MREMGVWLKVIGDQEGPRSTLIDRFDRLMHHRNKKSFLALPDQRR